LVQQSEFWPHAEPLGAHVAHWLTVSLHTRPLQQSPVPLGQSSPMMAHTPPSAPIPELGTHVGLEAEVSHV
jgi:hypothetical protein